MMLLNPLVADLVHLALSPVCSGSIQIAFHSLPDFSNPDFGQS